MTELGVNIDHVATIRQARGTAYPDLIEAARIAEEAGAYGITIHLREDRRHIQDQDVWNLKEVVKSSLNLEMALSPEIIEIACQTVPEEVCLVPEKRMELTTEGGLDVLRETTRLQGAINRLKSANILVSLFIDPVPEHIRRSKELGADIIELHTGSFANTSGEQALHELERIKSATALGLDLGLKVNAGHGLHYTNVQEISRIPGMGVLNIGHSIVARAIFTGLHQAVREMMELIRA